MHGKFNRLAICFASSADCLPAEQYCPIANLPHIQTPYMYMMKQYVYVLHAEAKSAMRRSCLSDYHDVWSQLVSVEQILKQKGGKYLFPQIHTFLL